MKVYLAGRLADPDIPTLTALLTKHSLDVFSEWYTPGPEADVRWRDYEQALGIDYITALQRPSAQNTYQFDKRHIDASDVMVAVLPCGKSAHLEIGYMIGKGKPVFLLMRDEPDRWDVMYNFVYENGGGIVKSVDDLVTKLKTAQPVTYKVDIQVNPPDRYSANGWPLFVPGTPR